MAGPKKKNASKTPAPVGRAAKTPKIIGRSVKPMAGNSKPMRAATPNARPPKPATRAAAKPADKPVREKLALIKPSGAKDDSFFDLVHEIARQIPRGRVTSYGAIAASLGTRMSARMVGWAMLSGVTAEKPVPTHRVVNRNGLLSGRHHYNPPEKMQLLLEKEGIVVKDSMVVDFKKLFWDPAKEL